MNICYICGKPIDPERFICNECEVENPGYSATKDDVAALFEGHKKEIAELFKEFREEKKND